MNTDISQNGVSLPRLDLGSIELESEDDGRMFYHNGTSTISLVNGESTSIEGYYTWVQEDGAWSPSGRNALLLNGFSSQELAKQVDFDNHTSNEDIHEELRTAEEVQNIVDGSNINIGGIATSTQDELDTHTSTENPHNITPSLIEAIPSSDKGVADGVAELDSNSKVPSGQLPAIAVSETFVVQDETERLALDAERGDIAIQQDESQSYILKGNDPTLNEDWEVLESPVSEVQTVFGRVGDVVAEQGDYSHSQLSGIQSDNHHERYTDTEAQNAVENANIDIGGEALSTRDSLDTHTAAENPHEITAEKIDAVKSTSSGEIFVGPEEPTEPNENDIWIRTE